MITVDSSQRLSTSTAWYNNSGHYLTVVDQAVRMRDDQLFAWGSDGDGVSILRATAIAADAGAADLPALFKGTDNHSAIAANSLIVSNVTQDGDILFVVNDGGNSHGLLHLYGAEARVLISTGTGAPAPDSLLHVWTGDAGDISAGASTVLALETAGTLELTFLTRAGDTVQLLQRTPTAGDITGLFFRGASASPPATVETVISDVSRLRHSAFTFTFQETTTVSVKDIISGSDIAGFNLILAAGIGRGTGNVGTVSVVLPIVGTAGDNPQTKATRLTFDMVGSTNTLTMAAAQALTISTTAGDLVLDSTASLKVILTDDISTGVEFFNSSTIYYRIDTRNTIATVAAHTFDTEAGAFASSATAVYSLAQFSAYNINWTGTDTVTDLVKSVVFQSPVLTSDTAILDVDKATNIFVAPPTQGTDVRLGITSAIRIGNAGGSPTNQYGIYFEALTAATGVNADLSIGIQIQMRDTTGINTGIVDDDYFTIGAVDNDTQNITELLRFVGAVKPYVQITNGLYLAEQAAALTDIGGLLQLWAKNDSPNTLMFTDDTGVDHAVAAFDSDSGEMAVPFGSSITVTVETADTPNAVKDISTGIVNDWTFAAGKTGAITVYADHSGTVGGTVRVTSTTHTLTDGDFITIRGSTNYNGVFEITTIDSDSFYITVAWNVDDGASDWEMGAYLLVASGAEGDYTLDWDGSFSEGGAAGSTVVVRIFQDVTELLKMTRSRVYPNNDVGSVCGGGHVAIVAADRIWVAIESSGTNDITILAMSLRLHRLG